ncbi:hypothetical protein AAFF_G00274340 [Aldrovandia affinis]|uniref:Cytochrome P450 n=1 Tax=Aldrovandia affinis TaxID=143900 RepID=A0AAD7WSG5_9TELE|nr:hypothetical protein AAFF_G00274340 [Aldrovandia affinis]
MLLQAWHELQNTVWSSACYLALVVFLTVYFVLHKLKKRKFSNVPPGPKPWPLVGNCGQFIVPRFVLKWLANRREKHEQARPISASPQVFLMELSKHYGNIYSLFIGNQLIVILTGYEVVRDALSNRADVFSDRPDVPLVTIMTKRKGIVFAPYGPVWRQQRKFCHATLRSFGLGRLSLEPRILEELAAVKTELLRISGEAEGQPVDPAPLVSNAVSNVISSISLGQRFHHGDREFRNLLELMARGLELCINSPAIFINVFPWLYYLPFGAFGEIRQVQRDITIFLKKIIAEHRSSLDPENPRDLIDMYLLETAQQQESAGAGRPASQRITSFTSSVTCSSPELTPPPTPCSGCCFT